MRAVEVSVRLRVAYLLWCWDYAGCRCHACVDDHKVRMTIPGLAEMAAPSRPYECVCRHCGTDAVMGTVCGTCAHYVAYIPPTIEGLDP